MEHELDVDDLDELIILVNEAFSVEALTEGFLPAGKARITNRMVSLKALEAKLIRLKGELT